MYTVIENWLNKILEQKIPENVVGLNFNLYEDGNYNWSMEIVGTDRFDEEDEDWCCDEVFDFGTRETPLEWNEDNTWDVILEEMIQIMKKYLDEGQYCDVLKNYRGVGIGFVDGDVIVLYKK